MNRVPLRRTHREGASRGEGAGKKGGGVGTCLALACPQVRCLGVQVVFFEVSQGGPKVQFLIFPPKRVCVVSWFAGPGEAAPLQLDMGPVEPQGAS